MIIIVAHHALHCGIAKPKHQGYFSLCWDNNSLAVPLALQSLLNQQYPAAINIGGCNPNIINTLASVAAGKGDFYSSSSASYNIHHGPNNRV